MESYRSFSTVTSRRIARIAILCLVGLGGCASTGENGRSHGLVGKALETIGLKKPSSETIPSQAKSVPLRLWAGANLNAGNNRRSLALVVKVYQLRDNQRFEQAPFAAFLDEDAERKALGDDLIRVSEIVLQPDQRHEFTEKLPPEATSLGVVALFRAPAPGRWRFSFDAAKAEKEGVTVGLHACALTTSSQALQSRIDGTPYSLTLARCSEG
ncbi:MAG: type VI secretion system lipoprotein TssJ [Pseudoxanthomonas sp.]